MITHIVATGLNLEIGKDNKLPWHLPEDLKHFKELTYGKTVVVGSNTYKSIQSYMKGKPFLEGRNVIVISSSPITVTKLADEYGQPSNVKYWTKPILDMYIPSLRPQDELLIIGGQQLYSTYKPDRILRTEVQVTIEDADAFYTFDSSAYDIVNMTETLRSSSGVFYKFIEYQRKI